MQVKAISRSEGRLTATSIPPFCEHGSSPPCIPVCPDSRPAGSSCASRTAGTVQAIPILLSAEPPAADTLFRKQLGSASVHPDPKGNVISLDGLRVWLNVPPGPATPYRHRGESGRRPRKNRHRQAARGPCASKRYPLILRSIVNSFSCTFRI